MKKIVLLFFISSISFAQTHNYRPFRMDLMVGHGDLLFEPTYNILYNQSNTLNNSIVVSVEPKYFFFDNLGIILKSEFFASTRALLVSSIIGLELHLGNSENIHYFGSIGAGVSKPLSDVQRPMFSARGGSQYGRLRVAVELNFVQNYSYYSLKTGFTIGGGRKQPKIPKPYTPPKPKEISEILVSGKVLDVTNNTPLKAKIGYFIKSENRNIDSTISSSKSGEYSFKLKPNLYHFTVSADGYEPFSDIVDLTVVNTKRQTLQDILLKPIVHLNNAEVLKVDENKFRLDKVYFELGSATILKSSHLQLDGLLAMMKKNPSMMIQIEGHTNRIGDEDENIKLSLNRASNVKKYLTSNGIDQSRIKTKGFGSSMPIVSEDSEDGRAKNRRVEFIILSQ